MFCTHCGHPNRDDARFCAECGALLQEDVTLTLPAVEHDDDARAEVPAAHAELGAGQALLLVTRGSTAGSTFVLDTEATPAGRNPDSEIFLDDVTVSRKHAVFERRHEGSWFVRDLGSLNGTYVNGEQVDETKLASRDEVQIGKFKLTFFAAGE